ncbi:2OG-Fe(II) oxygenase [Dyella sp. LX-66]|uniref:2OG-Fe(II) oxygenase n=1 Tax=unclassified Dyella TaxID=2634549 RepID=UPI001BE117B2|nr:MULTISPECIES: 2OG-Fe(II) oxygenase [unclassified Dyella]MBT2119269.1 2OG-Fe(II) oxygenase [Dyella sp. LX-1]MBT2141640.1 2OG-Fe(II) oxygenase [Dyella sp. LX-66]
MDRARIDAVIDALANEGWCVFEDLLPGEATAALAGECAARHASGELTAARIGREKLASTLRGDHTRWFEMDAPTAAQQPYVEALDALRVAFNRSLMLGLVESEAHYAVYPPGARYARHLDQPHQLEARVVSAVYYLNADWRAEDGGALRLYLDDGSHHDVLPQAGRMVLFLSSHFEHEVLPATRERMSIACWMRRREPGSLI